MRNKKENQKGSAVIIAIGIVAILAVGIALFVFSNKSQQTQGAPPHGIIAITSSTTTYQAPWGYKFSFPSHFHFAKDYMHLINGTSGTALILTSVSEDQEKNYVSQHPNGVMDNYFFPDQTLYITFDPDKFSDIKSAISEAKDPRINGDLQSVATKDGKEGIMYVQQHNATKVIVPFNLSAEIPFQPISYDLGVKNYIPNLSFIMPIVNSSSINGNENMLRMIINSLEFD